MDIGDPSLIKDLVGATSPPSDWVTVSQDRINRFADVSGDHQWIHVDVERSQIESPYGQTIAHGNLLLVIAAELSRNLLTFSYASRIVNYGFDKVRYLAPVPSGEKVRLVQSLTAAAARPDRATRLDFSLVLELEGSEKPALIAESVKLVYS